jgi:hypothetical protein
MSDNNLAQYLDNHLAGSVAGIELVKTMISEQRGTSLSIFLEKLLQELQEDQDVVRRALKELGQKESKVKGMGAWTLEKLAFSPLTGLADNSDLRPVVELEAILLATLGRCGMWLLLERFHHRYPCLAFTDFGLLRQRADRQAEELERYRQEAAASAFLH